jgi:O-succinylbenzoic acid--CoA ligase
VSFERGLLVRAAATPDAPALETPDGTLSFGRLADLAQRGATYLDRIDSGDDAPIALLLDGDADFAVWFHAAALAGRGVLPLNLRLTADELVQQLEDAGARCLLGMAADPRLAELTSRLPLLRAEPPPRPASLPQSPVALAPRGRDDGRTLAVLYTSGTSGRPKGACLSWGNFLASAVAAEERLGESVRGRWLACMPLFHVGGLSMLVRSVVFGAPVRLHARFDAGAVSDTLDGGDIVGISLVPTMLSRLLEHRGPRRAPAGLQVVLLGGAAAPAHLVRRALEAGYPLCPTYGLTEATSQVATASRPLPGATAPQPMRVVSGTQLRIVGEGREAAVGEPGEILVRGPTVMQGYLNNPAATAHALRDGWLHTGDIGCLDAQGALLVLDRRDDLIVSGGENVYPAEVEAVLLEHPSVAEAGVAGVPDADLGARVTAWIVAAAGPAPSLDELQRHCRERLAGYKQPREFRFVVALPRTASGKLQRRQLGR